MSSGNTVYHQTAAYFQKHRCLPDSLPTEHLREMIDAAPKGSALERALKERRFHMQ